MKVLSALLLFGALVAQATSKPAKDSGMAQLLLRSCDRNADSALNAAEFAGCLMQTSWQQRMAARGMAISRSELLQSFMDKADMNNDLRADETELQEWSQRWFLTDLFGGGDDGDDDDGGDDGGDDDDDDDGLSFSMIISKIIVILEYISSENYAGAVSELYALVSGSSLSEDSQLSITLAIAAIEIGNYGEAIGNIYAVIREIAGGEDSGGIFVVSTSTVTSVASLLQAVIEGDSANINLLIYKSLSGIITDFTVLSAESASAVAALVQAVVESNTEQFYNSLTQVVDSISGISSELATALTILIQTAANGDDVGSAFIDVMIALFEEDGPRQIANTFVAVIQAVMDGDTDEAIEQLTLLYAQISGGSSDEDRVVSAQVVAEIETVIQSINDEDSNEAISIIEALLEGQNGGDSLSRVVRNELEVILTDLRDESFSEAIVKLLIISAGARSSSLSTASTATLLTALQSVSSGSSSSAVTSLELLLEENISSSFRSEIEDIIAYLDEENYARAMTLVVESVIGSGNSISASVAESLYDALRLSISGYYDEAASQIDDIFDDEDDLDSDIALVLLYVAQLLREENSQGALTAINAIIEEAFGADECYCG